MIKPRTLTIPKDIHQAMVQHAVEELPNESCGYLAGTDDDVKAFYPMTNMDQSPEHFSFDPKEQFEAMKKARDAGHQLISVYHSHPETPARLSQEDITLLNDPSMVYIIVSMLSSPPDARGYLLNKPDENTIEISEVKLQLV